VDGKAYKTTSEFTVQDVLDDTKTITGTIHNPSKNLIRNIGLGWSLRFNNERYFVLTSSRRDTRDGITITFSAISEFYWRFKKSSIGSFLSDGSHEAYEYLNFIFNGSDYTYQQFAYIPALVKQSFGGTTRLRLFNDFVESVGMEYRINEETKTVTILETRGRDFAGVIKKKLNLTRLTSETNAADFVTYQKGFGAYIDDEDHSKGRLETEYLSPLSSVYGILEAEPLFDERFTQEESLRQRLQQNVAESHFISFNIDFEELKQLGYTQQDVQCGDSLQVINQDIEFNQRIRIVSVSKQYNTKGILTKTTVECGDRSNVNRAARQRLEQEIATKPLVDMMKDYPSVGAFNTDIAQIRRMEGVTYRQRS